MTDRRRSFLGVVRWVLNRRRWRTRLPRRIAGVMQTRNYRDDLSSFETLAGLSDVTIVLDDNSTEPFVHAAACTEYLSLRGSSPWSHQANLNLLLYRAFVHGCEWVVTLDDDMLTSHGFQDKAAVHAVIDRMEAESLDLCRFRVRDLWESSERYRSDGVWGQKTTPVIRRNWFFWDGISFRDPALRLEVPAFPENLRVRWSVDPTHVVYHAGNLTDERRRARVEKYRREDPENAFQSDYSYI
ncbi:MAG: hypothetical protein JO102_04315, partial [Elusimicrobia bacterium]|nr:hypothetical protein [Elusimicrobiota bacterium]